MSPNSVHKASNKRKAVPATDSVKAVKSQRIDRAPFSMITPHEPVIAELAKRYNVLPASVITSTKIRTRVQAITSHLLTGKADDAETVETKPRAVLLYAWSDYVVKMITVVEQVKRILGEEGKDWWQYNQMYDQPVRSAQKKQGRAIVEETVLNVGESKKEGEDEEDEEDDEFEVMPSRLERALLPPPKSKVIRSMRIFISLSPMQELKMKENVTMQTSEKTA